MSNDATIMSQVLGRLKNDYNLAWVAVSSQSGVGSFLLGGPIGYLTRDTNYDNLKSVLNTYGGVIDDLSDSGHLGKKVSSGEMELQRWLNIAQTLSEGIAQVRIDAGEAGITFDRVWNEIVTPTANTIATGVEDIGSGSTPYIILFVVLFAAVLAFRLT